ncbi:MAG: PAS domain-containing protein [Proteobacteria bacterium]|nr:PAS domain-containing protein [Pseudomonadota bacterium]
MTLSSPPDFNPDTYATLAAMVDVAPLLIASIGPDQRYRLVNAEYEKIWGKPRDWFVGRRVADTLPEEIYRCIEPYLHTALAGSAVDFEYEGHYVPSEPLVLRDMRARYTPNIVNGRQDGIVVVVEDITDYRSVERAMRTAQQQLRDIVDNVPVFIAYLSADSRYRFVNSAYERWYGRPRDWFVGRSVQEVMGAQVFAGIEAQWQRAMNGEAVNFSFERLSPDGREVRILEAYLVPDHGPQGVQGIYTLVTDDTERRLAEDAALRAQWKMRAVADNLPALITYIDAEMRYRYVNAGFLSWYQRPAHAFIGKRVAEVVGEVYALTGPLMERALRGESIDFDYLRQNEHFSEPGRVMRVRLLPDTVAGVTRGFIALIEDITDARRAEHVLRQAEQELRAVLNAIPVLVAVFDMEARFTYVNRQFADWCGKPESFFPGRRLDEVLSSDVSARAAVGHARDGWRARDVWSHRSRQAAQRRRRAPLPRGVRTVHGRRRATRLRRHRAGRHRLGRNQSRASRTGDAPAPDCQRQQRGVLPDQPAPHRAHLRQSRPRTDLRHLER